jgi:hypothetical protein
VNGRGIGLFELTRRAAVNKFIPAQACLFLACCAGLPNFIFRQQRHGLTRKIAISQQQQFCERLLLTTPAKPLF